MKRIYLMILFLFLPTIAIAFQQVEFKMEFGQEGAGPGQMQEPSDIAVDSDGKIFVTDTGNKRINIMGPDGNIIASWSNKESNRGTMGAPSGIVLYEDKVYVTDSDLDKVLIFTRDGKCIDEFGSRGSAPKQFDEPKGIYVHQGIIYVADTGNHRIQIFSLEGIYLQSIGVKGTEIGQMHSPTDVAVDQNGYIYVSEAGNNRVQVFDAYGKYYRDYHDVVKPSSLCIDKNGFFVADAGNFQIKKFDFEGHLLVSFGSKGEGQAQFRALSGISLDRDGNVFAVDTKKNTIQKFSPEKYKGAFPEFAPPLNSVRWLHDIPVYVADMIWHDDVLYATSQKEDSIFIIQQGMVRKVIMGQGTERLDDPSGIAIDPEGFLWVVDSNNNRVLRLNKDGKVKSVIGAGGKQEGYFSSPQGIAISQKGIVYIADSGNKRVQIFNTDGVYMSKIENIYSERFERPVDLDVDVSGNIFVVDEDANRVYVFNAEGRYVQSIGKKGEGDGELKRPTCILVTMDEIFVLDSGNYRIQIFDHKGRFLRKFGTRGNGKGDFIEPLRLALKDETTLFVSDVGNEKIQEFGILYTPRTPLNIKAESGMREINLRWSKGLESFVSHYNVYRSENKKTYELIASPVKPSFVDKNVKLGMTYFYKVSAVAKNGNESGESDFIAAGIKKILSSPPGEIKVTVGENEILFMWEPDKEGHVASYVMYREIDGRFQEIGRIKTTSFTDKGLKPDTPYLYKITSISIDDEESEGVPIKVTTKKKVIAPPTHIKVFPAVDEITLSWQLDKEGNGTSKEMVPHMSFIRK
ncbi:MAG: 6-bladed beta-propeller [Nitrospira sp.]|nr:6-bladed beta-propeller [Nitrospira sp.]